MSVGVGSYGLAVMNLLGEGCISASEVCRRQGQKCLPLPMELVMLEEAALKYNTKIKHKNVTTKPNQAIVEASLLS